MTDRLVLRGLRFQAYVGVSEAERGASQPVELDLEVPMPLAAAGRSDDLRRALDYAALFKAVKGVVEGQRFHLLEAVAEQAAEAARATGAPQVLVRARKFRPPVDGHLEIAEVVVER